jgi:hypothetical protein
MEITDERSREEQTPRANTDERLREEQTPRANTDERLREEETAGDEHAEDSDHFAGQRVQEPVHRG